MKRPRTLATTTPPAKPLTWREAHPALDDILTRMRLEAIGLAAPEFALALLHLNDCAGYRVGSDEDGTIALAALRGMQALGSVIVAEASAVRALHRGGTVERPPLAMDDAGRAAVLAADLATLYRAAMNGGT